MKKRKFIGLILVLTITLIGWYILPKNHSVQPAENADKPTTILPERPILVYADGYLKIIRTSDGSELSSYTLDNGMSPLSFKAFESIQVSSSGLYAIWFVPAMGMVRLNTENKSVSVFYAPSEWFLENPYYQFYGDTNTVILIDSQGKEMVWANLDTDTISKRPVPYPFGTIFSISPDLHKILFVEGYRQSGKVPTYLVTDIEGMLITRFHTQAEIADRHRIVWGVDSNSVITVETNNTLMAYSLNEPHQPTLLYNTSDSETILQLESHNGNLFFRTEQFLYLYDAVNQRLIKRLPVEAMLPLNRPRPIYLDNEYFYIEEDVREFESLHKRLWVSDWMGSKSMILPEYGMKVTVEVE